MSKKVLSIVLAIVFALSCFAVSAFAIGEIGYEEEGNTFKQEWSLSEAAQDADGNWYVEVSLKAYDTALIEAYRVGAMQFKLDITGGITIADVVKGSALTDGFGADIAFDSTGASNIVAIIPNPYEDASEALDLSNGGVLCTVYFTVADGASGTVQIVDDAKSATNPGGTLFAARMTDGVLSSGTSVIGQTTTIETETRNIGAVATAELVLTALGTTNGVIIDNAKTFGGAYAGVVYGFHQAANNTFKNQNYLYGNTASNLTATNGGTLKITKTATGFGTGTTVEVLNSDGSSTNKIYVVVIFGDVTGDGLMNTTDATNIYNSVNGDYVLEANSIYTLAANCHATNATLAHRVNTNDALEVYKHSSGIKINAAALAAKHAGFNNNYQ